MPSYAERYPLSDASNSEEDCVLRWRDEQFRALGFEPSEALVLAVSKADLHEARALIAAGCTLPLAAKILL